jgi:3-oxoacyl-[acyl-carrier-protein] synthase-3/clorobiocin biosynthesis protein CloN2
MFPPGVTTGRAVDFAKRARKYGRSPWPAIYPHLRDLVDYVTKQAGEPARVVLTNAGRIETGQLLAALDVPMEHSTWEFGRTVGQLGAADQIVSLDWLLHTGALRAGDHVLLVGVGQGITLSAAVIEIVHTQPWLA